MSSFRELVIAEKGRAREEWGDFTSIHEVYGVLCEDLADFMEQIRAGDNRDAEAMLKIFVQLAASAEDAAEDLGLVQAKEEGGHEDRKLKEVVQDFLDKAVVSQLINRLQPNKNGDSFVSNVKTLLVSDEAYSNLLEAVKN